MRTIRAPSRAKAKTKTTTKKPTKAKPSKPANAAAPRTRLRKRSEQLEIKGTEDKSVTKHVRERANSYVDAIAEKQRASEHEKQERRLLIAAMRKDKCERVKLEDGRIITIKIAEEKPAVSKAKKAGRRGGRKGLVADTSRNGKADSPVADANGRHADGPRGNDDESMELPPPPKRPGLDPKALEEFYDSQSEGAAAEGAANDEGGPA